MKRVEPSAQVETRDDEGDPLHLEASSGGDRKGISQVDVEKGSEKVFSVQW